VGNIKIDKLNFCANPSSNLEKNDDIIRDDQIIVESAQKQIKRETIPRLVKLGLTAEQIAEALDLPLSEVKKIVAISN
jgi:predicted transposase YdaD